MKLGNLELRKYVAPPKIDSGHVVVEAFRSGGEPYFKLFDMFNTFTRRGMDALSVYQQWEQRCSRSFLIEHSKAVDAVLRSKTVNMVDLIKLNDILIERLKFALPTEEIIWQFAAVAYFDKNESPYVYDDNYAKQKIKKWKANNDIADFFLLMPIRDLIPLPDYSKEDLQTFFRVEKQVTVRQLQTIQEIFSRFPQRKGL